MELVRIIQSANGGTRNARRCFREFGAERPATLSKPFIELDNEVV